jgi:hypothetical protein
MHPAAIASKDEAFGYASRLAPERDAKGGSDDSGGNAR